METKSNWTASDIQQMVANPFYCLAGEQQIISEEEWIKAGAKLIRAGCI